MRVQRVTNYNNNNNKTNFGELKGIVCHGLFSKSNPKHALAINEVLTSDAFKKFGEMYDYIAHFKHSQYFDYAYYDLVLAPAEECSFSKSTTTSSDGFLRNLFGRKQDEIATPIKEEETIQISNLPLKFTVCNASDTFNFKAYDAFMKKLKSENLDSLNYSLKYAIEGAEREQKKAQELENASKQAFENIEKSGIAIY